MSGHQQVKTGGAAVESFSWQHTAQHTTVALTHSGRPQCASSTNCICGTAPYIICIIIHHINHFFKKRKVLFNMLFTLEDDVSDAPHHIEVDVDSSSSGSLTVEQLLLHFVKFRNIKSPGAHINVKDLCMCHITGSGKKMVEKQLLPSSVIDVKATAGASEQVFKIYGLAGQLAAHREEVEKLRSFKTLVNSLSSDIDHFIEKQDSVRVGSKR